ncbi:MAG: CRISPR-associated endonuclease Cas6 [candidate division KSB1 bacterium]|nr:CRISPR-associated endonuclease Cas6 [candidate division KSB1 bacterium]
MEKNNLISKVRYAILLLMCDKIIPIRYGHHLRGWLMERFPDQPLVSHHQDSGRSVYMYPRVQSKIVAGNALILGIDEGVDFITEIISHPPSCLSLNREDFIVKNVLHEQASSIFGVVGVVHQYKFLTPWLGLNQENYRNYSRTVASKERQNLLASILIGNVLSAAKSLGIMLAEQIEVRPFLKPIRVHFKGKSMIGFNGTFRANLHLPDLIGLGKSVSRGFGTVIRITDKNGSNLITDN